MTHDIAFLFDLDGVLIDSERRYTRIWQGIDDEFHSGVADLPRVIKGMTLQNILAEYFPDPEVSKQVEERLLAGEEKMEYAYMPGAERLLTRLKEMGVPMALVTSSDEVKMASLRKKMPGILSWFDAVVDGDMVTHGKPDPEPYLTGARLLGVDPRNCVVVEDALTGIEAGHRAGAYVVGMTDTLGREVIEPRVEVAYDSLEDIDLQSIINKVKGAGYEQH